jgi:hypothetical protein
MPMSYLKKQDDNQKENDLLLLLNELPNRSKLRGI